MYSCRFVEGIRMTNQEAKRKRSHKSPSPSLIWIRIFEPQLDRLPDLALRGINLRYSDPLSFGNPETERRKRSNICPSC
jgi:hypothetical protein